MATIFFEWSDYEALQYKEQNIDFATEVTFQVNTFNLVQAKGFATVSIFVASRISDNDLKQLADNGCKTIALRCAGYNMLNVTLAKQLGISVYRVASYSPESIAEYVFALILNLARKMNLQRKLHAQSKEQRDIQSMGFLLHGKTLGLHGFGKIGQQVARIAFNGFGMQVKFFDPYISQTEADKYIKTATLAELYATCDIVSIHTPLLPETKGTVDKSLLSVTKPDFMLINTSRGPIVNNEDLLAAIKTGTVKYFGTDVWGEDDAFAQELLTDNAFQSNHIAFFTDDAVLAILRQTAENITGKARIENTL